MQTATGPDPATLAAVLTPQVSCRQQRSVGQGPASVVLVLLRRIGARDGCLTESSRNVRTAENSLPFLFAVPGMGFHEETVYYGPRSVIPASDGR